MTYTWIHEQLVVQISQFFIIQIPPKNNPTHSGFIEDSLFAVFIAHMKYIHQHEMKAL